MLKTLLKPLRKQLLKLDWIKRAVADSLQRLKEERASQRRAHLMSAGYTVRKYDKPLKLDISDTPTDEVIVGYSDGRMIGQRQVTPIMVRPFGMGKAKW